MSQIISKILANLENIEEQNLRDFSKYHVNFCNFSKVSNYNS
jgi:hypothetical protein